MNKITEVVFHKNIEIPMRDGTKLRADHLRPVCDEPVPTLLTRTPYLKESIWDENIYNPMDLALHGYNVIMCDVRGGGQSEGTFTPFKNERKDGYDTIEWIAKQPWHTGMIGTFGYSYFGGQQILAASTQPPSLGCIIPGACSGEWLPTFMYGVFAHRTSLFWYMKQLRNALKCGKGDMSPEDRAAKLDEIEFIMKEKKDSECYVLPLLDAEVLKFEGVPLRKFFNEWVDNADNEQYWKQMGQPLGIDKCQVPGLFHTGWFDYMAPGVVDNFEILSHKTDNPELAKKHKLIMGPWAHICDYGESTESDSGVVKCELVFPPNSGYTAEMHEDIKAFYDKHLKGMDVDTGAPVQIYVIGDNVWREEQEWPLARTQYTPLYLDSKGCANSLKGDGKLGFDLPCGSDFDSYDYNPMCPHDNTGCDIHKGIIKDRTCMEMREDMLVYTTETLEEDIEITGNVQAKLFIKSSAVDTDFYVRLIDVQPDGKAYSYLTKPYRMRYREGFYNPVYMTPGEVYPVDYKLGPISLVFKKGHKIRIEITSSDFPEYDRNLNTDEKFGYGKNYEIAHQIILHDEVHPSHILLPIIPR